MILFWCLVLHPQCLCNGGGCLGAATTKASCDKTSCSGATEVGASKQGSVDPTSGTRLSKGNPCLNCGHRRPPALWCHFVGFLFWIPDAIVMAVPTLVPPQKAHLVTKPWNAWHFHGYIRIPGSPGWVPRLLTMHQTEWFLKSFFWELLYNQTRAMRHWVWVDQRINAIFLQQRLGWHKPKTFKKPHAQIWYTYQYAYFWLHMPPSPYLVTAIAIFLPVQVEK